MYKKILITGCSGYIGTYLTKLLSKLNYALYGLDINIPGDLAMYSKFFHENVNTFNNVQEYDCVVHLAALVKVNESTKKPGEYYTTNLHGTVNLLENIKTSNFIFASTGVVSYLNNPYSISKAAAEYIVKQYCLKNKINFSIFRFSNVLGGIPTNQQGLMYHLLDALSTKTFTIYGHNYNTPDGTCVRDYVHVEEICNSIIQSINTPTNSIEELGYGIGYSVKEMVDIFKSVNNVEFDVLYEKERVGDLPSTIAKNPSKFLNKIYTIEQSLKVI